MRNMANKSTFETWRLGMAALIFNSPLFSQINLTSDETVQAIRVDKCGTYNHTIAMQQLSLFGDH